MIPLVIIERSTGDKKVHDTWGVEFYTWSVEISALILVCAYAITFCKAWAGTRYPFILLLITLLFFSNLGAGMAGIYGHYAT